MIYPIEGWQRIDSTTDQFYRDGVMVGCVSSSYGVGAELPDFHPWAGRVRIDGRFDSLESARVAVERRLVNP